MSVVYPKIYRFTNLGTALTQSLNEFVQEGKITAEQKESILKEYDKEMALELARVRPTLPTAKLTGDVTFYKRLFDTWTFSLSNWVLYFDNDDGLVDLQATFFTTLGVDK